MDLRTSLNRPGLRVYHGTGWAFRPDISNDGICPPPGHGPGVRVHLDLASAVSFARAYAAWQLYERTMLPQGLIVGAVVDESRIRADRKDRPQRHGEVFRISQLRADEVYLKRIDFPELADEGPLTAALELFEEITEADLHLPYRSAGPRSSILLPRNVPV